MKRYPGIRPFTAEDRHLFYGRDKEQRDLYRKVILNDIVVLFGKSGTGKSSLLNAGVCPQLEDRNLHPVFIRLNNTGLAPDRQIFEFLREHHYIPKDMPEGLTLWEYFKRFWYVDLGEVYTPVIILDQFEELFTLYTPEERQNFIDQFADIANGRMPAALQKKIKTPAFASNDKVDWRKPPAVKFILSIRSDYLYLLNELSADIPSILRTRFQLDMLTRSNAIQAITLPAMAEGRYESPAFQYEEKTLNEIIDVLGKKETDQLRSDLPDSEPEIEAFQLQMFCQQIESKIIADNKPAGFTVESGFFGGKAGIQKIIGAFYSSVISRVPQDHQIAVETLVATYLIRNKRRIIMEESAIREECNIPQNILDQLHEERLLRKEARTGHFYYEISHDTLIEPVLKKYQYIAVRLEREKQEKERLEKEKELVAIRQKAEEERQRAEEQMQLREKAEKSTLRAKQRTWLAMAALIIAFLLAFFAGWNWWKAEKALEELRATAFELDQKQEALIAAEDSIAAKEKYLEALIELLEETTGISEKSVVARMERRTKKRIQEYIVKEKTGNHKDHDHNHEKLIAELYAPSEGKRVKATSSILRNYKDDSEIISEILKSTEAKINNDYLNSLYQIIYILQQLDKNILITQKIEIQSFIKQVRDAKNPKNGAPLVGASTQARLSSIERKLR